MAETGYDAIPIEVRRAMFGWFGEPWWSYVCFDDTGRPIEEMHKPVPAGESCLYCGELFDEAAGDNGQAMPLMKADGPPEIRHVHKECLMRNVVGSVDCMQGHHGHDSGQTYRQEALASWAWVQEHGARAMP